ncbi:MAG: sensor histidine kinase [Gaiellales bacterium]
MNFVLRPFRSVTYRELAYLLLGLPMSIVAFTVFVTGVSVGVALAVFVIGIPVLIGAAYANRGVAMVERYRAALVLGSPIASSYRKPSRPGFFPLAGSLATDPQTWRDAGWLMLGTVVSFTFSIVALVLWSVVIWALTFPLYGWGIRDGALQLSADIAPDSDLWRFLDHFGDLERVGDTTDWHAQGALGLGLIFLVGVALLPVTAWACAGMARSQGLLARLLLGPTASETRVAELTRTRAASVDAQASELRRIERDLHDGAQARMVAVTLDLGLAKEKLESDPEAARALVEQAHTEARTAIKELRELVAGIAPAVLTDRGLDAALSALVATCRIPVDLDVSLPERLPTAVEVAAYFVVAETLTNVQKHSGAARVTVHARVQGDRLIVEVGDDGQGGADPAGAGLTGLRDRVAALDGTLAVLSPAGGPTTIRAEIPCAS